MNIKRRLVSLEKKRPAPGMSNEERLTRLDGRVVRPAWGALTSTFR